ncbi:hypothetical protein QWZ13_03625 [Reinekea marina]|nr:hypothetical protein [Reinekea marina]MDN3647995.1 hypothetical protein [Reinekea marina]
MRLTKRQVCPQPGQIKQSPLGYPSGFFAVWKKSSGLLTASCG